MDTRKLGQLQEDFLYAQGKLVVWAREHGFHLRPGEMRRSDEQAEINAIGSAGRHDVAQVVFARYPGLAKALLNNTGDGIRGSLHELGLAVDLSLIVNGKLAEKPSDYQPVADFWLSLDPLARWGGVFASPDADHFSFEFGGKR